MRIQTRRVLTLTQLEIEAILKDYVADKFLEERDIGIEWQGSQNTLELDDIVAVDSVTFTQEDNEDVF